MDSINCDSETERIQSKQLLATISYMVECFWRCKHLTHYFRRNVLAMSLGFTPSHPLLALLHSAVCLKKGASGTATSGHLCLAQEDLKEGRQWAAGNSLPALSCSAPSLPLVRAPLCSHTPLLGHSCCTGLWGFPLPWVCNQPVLESFELSDLTAPYVSRWESDSEFSSIFLISYSVEEI